MTIKQIEKDAIEQIRRGFIPVCWLHPDDVSQAFEDDGGSAAKIKMSRAFFEELADWFSSHLVDDSWWANLRYEYNVISGEAKKK